jgi:transcriptional regulator with XRE-family HTH domain
MTSTRVTAASQGTSELAGDLARRLITARTALNLSIEEVAERADVQPNYLRYLESSTCVPSDICLRSLANALATSEESLLGAARRTRDQRDA